MCKLSANNLIISSQTYLCIIPLQLPLLHTVAPTEKGKETDLFKWIYNAQIKAFKKKKQQYTNLIIATNIFCTLKKTSSETICNLLHLKRVFPMDDFLAAETEEAHITAEECSEWKTYD